MQDIYEFLIIWKNNLYMVEKVIMVLFFAVLGGMVFSFSKCVLVWCFSLDIIFFSSL